MAASFKTLTLLLVLAVVGTWYVAQSDSPLNDSQLSAAREYAARAPVLSIMGTDPERLLRAVESLERVQEEYGMELYPVTFLREVARAEQARLGFIHKPTAEHWGTYATQLGRTFDAYQKDLRTFTQNFKESVPEDTKAYTVPEGFITRAQSILVLETLAREVDNTHERFKAHVTCIGGSVSTCEEESLPPLPATTSTTLPPAVQEILTLLREGKGRDEPTTIVALTSSHCAARQPTPHPFALYESPEHALDFEYVGDLYFYPMSVLAGSYAKPFKERGVSYVPFSPANFYRCPNIMSDLARIAATELAYEAFEINPQTLAGVPLLYESKAIEAVNASSSPLRHVFANQSAGLDTLVEHIVKIREADKQSAARGMPQEEGLDYLYRVKSAFLALYLAHNPSVARNIPPLVEAHTSTHTIRTWSDLKGEVDRGTIVHDLRVYSELQGVLTGGEN